MWHFSIHDGSQWQPVNQFLRMSALVRSSTMLTKHMSTCSRTCEGREGTNRNIVRSDAGEPRFCPPKHAHWWAASSRADRWAFGRPQIPLASKDLESCELHSNSSWEDKQSCCCLVLGEKSSLDSPQGNPMVWGRQWLWVFRVAQCIWPQGSATLCFFFFKAFKWTTKQQRWEWNYTSQ